MAELDDVMNTIMNPMVKVLKISERAKKLKLKLKDIKKMSEKEIQEKFGDIR